MDLNRLFPAVSRGERDALKEIYDAYRIPFYFAALSILKMRTMRWPLRRKPSAESGIPRTALTRI